MPALIVTGFVMLFFLLSGLTDKNPNAKYEPRRVDPMSVPYDSAPKQRP